MGYQGVWALRSEPKYHSKNHEKITKITKKYIDSVSMLLTKVDAYLKNGG
jgi:hypothetical protein